MKLSIVTISYNQGEFLEKAIQSVLCQKDYGVDLEYIVVDPGSTDGSREIISKYKSQIDKVIFDKDSGPADGLNKGFSVAEGSIYGYLNADDEYLPGCLSEVLKLFSKYPNIDVMSGHGFVIDEKDNILHRCFSNKFKLKSYLYGNCVVVQQSTFFKSSIFNTIGGFKIDNKVSWDGELMVDMALANARFKRVSKYWSNFRVYSNSISGSGLFLEKSKERRKLLTKRTDKKIKDNKIYSYLNYFITRIVDPALVLLRIHDGIINGKRKIPR